MTVQEATPKATVAPLTLRDKYVGLQSAVQLTGTQALLRLLIERYRHDLRQELETATFVSGYPGSPLGGFDSLLLKEVDLLSRHHIVFRPGVNEELAITAAMGSQVANTFDDLRYDGVCSVWFGKTPGLDRALDGLKHANYVGVGRYGGGLAIVGDDQACKSSTIPNSSEYSFMSAHVPVFYPGSVEEVIELGLGALALSRYAGLWAGFKIVAEVADGGSLVRLRESYEFTYPSHSEFEEGSATRIKTCFPPDSIEEERHITYQKMRAVAAFIRANDFNRIMHQSDIDRVGFVAAGKTYYDLIKALRERLGLDLQDLTVRGIRLLKLGVTWPLEETIVKDFARGLETVFVVEEKQALIENQIKSILFNQVQRPCVYGKQDAEGRPLFPLNGDLSADFIAGKLRSVLGVELPAAIQHGCAVDPTPKPATNLKREPWFCSGCPHNRSTRVPNEAVVGGGIGCHTLSILMNRNVKFMCQMGGEGAAWIGISPFVATDHIFQNVGDGTFFHSGSLALRAAVASRVNITYKILYNGAISMTGGQQVQGARDIASLCHLLLSEGVASVDVVSERPTAINALRLPRGVRVHARTELDSVQRRLRMEKGVSALIYDQRCALEKRRDRKRLDTRAQLEVYVAKEICEACGDCATKSNCISLGWKDTPFGRKVHIQQSSCNQDYSCVEAECPSFFQIERAVSRRHTAESAEVAPEPDRVAEIEKNCRVLLAGVGGTGVTTISAILAHASWIESKYNVHLDQTGMAQKGGAVVSHLTISNKPIEVSSQIGTRECDVLIAFDSVTVQTRNLLPSVDKERTHIIFNVGETVTGRQIGNSSLKGADSHLWAEWFGYVTDEARRRFLAVDLTSPEIAQHVDPPTANVFLLGIAYQRGVIPLRAESIEQAVRLNEVKVKENLHAFRLGRWWAARKPRLQSAHSIEQSQRTTDDSQLPVVKELVSFIKATRFPSDVREVLLVRAKRLHEYHTLAFAIAYVEAAARMLHVSFVATYPIVSKKIFHLMFKFRYIKDEYEVARLALLVRSEVSAELGKEEVRSITANVSVPVVRHLFGNRKLRVPEWVGQPLFYVLSKLWVLRHSPLDPFALGSAERRARKLRPWFDSLVPKIVSATNQTTAAQIEQVLDQADQIRGYGTVRARRIADVVPEVERQLEDIMTSTTSGRFNESEE